MPIFKMNNCNYFDLWPFLRYNMIKGLKMSRSIQLQNVVWKEGKFYVAQCLNVEVSSFGKTKKEALDNLNEALELYFEDQKPIKIVKIENPSIVKHQLQYA